MKRSVSRYSVSPARSRYSVTTLEPGASEVFTHGWTSSPRWTALRASTPAPSMTDGFEVFVQLVIAAMTTWPWSSSNSSPDSVSTWTWLGERSAIAVATSPRAGASSRAPAWSRPL